MTCSELARRPGWKKRCRELNRVSRHWVPDLGEDYEEACLQRGELALAGQRWADNDQNPLEQSVHKLHGMFVAVLRAKMQREEEACLLFPVEQRKAPQDCYPWHQLQPPFPKPRLTELPELGPLPKDWKWGGDFLPAVLRWLSELQWLPSDDSLPEAYRQVSLWSWHWTLNHMRGHLSLPPHRPDSWRCPYREKAGLSGRRQVC